MRGYLLKAIDRDVVAIVSGILAVVGIGAIFIILLFITS